MSDSDITEQELIRALHIVNRCLRITELDPGHVKFRLVPFGKEPAFRIQPLDGEVYRSDRLEYTHPRLGNALYQELQAFAKNLIIANRETLAAASHRKAERKAEELREAAHDPRAPHSLKIRAKYKRRSAKTVRNQGELWLLQKKPGG